jgi:hypothetical protein
MPGTSLHRLFALKNRPSSDTLQELFDCAAIHAEEMHE